MINDSKTTWVGADAQIRSDILSLNYPIEQGIVTNWDDMQEIWNYQFTHDLKIFPDCNPIMLTEPPLNPRGNREKMAELMFESFQVPALYLGLQAVLAWWSTSPRGASLVIDSGDGVTHIVPVLEGFAVSHGIQRFDVAGADLTRYLMRCLHESGHDFVTSAKVDTIKDIKEKLCYVASDFYHQTEDVASYELPDSRVIKVGSPRFKAPEALFRPKLLGMETPGIHEIVRDSISKCDVNIHMKNLFWLAALLCFLD